MITLDDINTELALLAEQATEERIDDQYQEFLEEMYRIFDMQQWANDQAEEDVIRYGE